MYERGVIFYIEYGFFCVFLVFFFRKNWSSYVSLKFVVELDNLVLDNFDFDNIL